MSFEQYLHLLDHTLFWDSEKPLFLVKNEAHRSRANSMKTFSEGLESLDFLGSNSTQPGIRKVEKFWKHSYTGEAKREGTRAFDKHSSKLAPGKRYNEERRANQRTRLQATNIPEAWVCDLWKGYNRELTGASQPSSSPLSWAVHPKGNYSAPLFVIYKAEIRTGPLKGRAFSDREYSLMCTRNRPSSVSFWYTRAIFIKNPITTIITIDWGWRGLTENITSLLHPQALCRDLCPESFQANGDYQIFSL